MPRGPKKKTTSKPTSYFALLLVKIILIQIGSTPLWLISSARAISPFRSEASVAIFYGLKTFSRIVIRLPRYILRSCLAMTRLVKHNHRRGRPKKFHMRRQTKIILAISGSLIFLFVYTSFILTAAYQLPTPTRLVYPREPLTTEFYDRNGNLLYRLYEDKNRTLVKLPEIPKQMIQATIAIEDQNFYKHMGIDPIAILRAFYHNLRSGGLEGASTITQQLIKNSLLTPEKSYIRKVKEILLAVWTERIYSKDQILQMYFNEAPYGGTNVGIAAAAEAFFGKTPSQLDLAESSYLAGLPASPTQFSPYGSRPDLAKLRQKDVLARMVKEGYITPKKADEAFAQNLNIRPPVNNIHAPHFVYYIRDLLTEKYGPRIVAQGGLKIYTSLDLKIQEEVEKIVSGEVDNLSSLDVKNGAAMVLDATNGQILAMVGSRDYHYPGFGNFNVTLALRQPGSSIKPVTYATAFKQGFNPGTIILDTPVTFGNNWGQSYSPVNYDGRFHGPVTLRQALGSSLNIPAVKLLATVGIPQTIQTAKDLGISTFTNPDQYGLALTLGGADTKMVEMMGVYGAFAGSGRFRQPTGILKVTDSSRNLLEEYKNSPKQALSPQVSYLITNILSDDNARQSAFGRNSLLNIPGYQVAVKTGTSDNKRDNWTFGYTPKFVVGVWVGNPDNSPMNPLLTSGVTGAAPIWNKIMHQLLDGSKPLAFEKPSGISDSIIDGRKDISLTETLPKSIVRVQKTEDNVIFSDNFSSFATPSAQTASKQGYMNIR